MDKKTEYKILSLACLTGKIMLQNGSEVYSRKSYMPGS